MPDLLLSQRSGFNNRSQNKEQIIQQFLRYLDIQICAAVIFIQIFREQKLNSNTENTEGNKGDLTNLGGWQNYPHPTTIDKV
jgi:hypothetical protein